MASQTPTLSKPPAPPQVPHGPSGGGWGSSPDGDAAVQPVSPAKIGVWLLVGAVTVLFAAFTATYLTRRGQPGWTEVPLPPVLWVSTLLLALGSGVLEWVRRRGQTGDLTAMRSGLVLATVLGSGFLAGQLVAWRQLMAAGLYLASNPHSSFFFLLTGAHGLHALGGIAALLYAVTTAYRTQQAARAVEVTEPTAIYWHFLGLLWVYLFALLFWV